MDAYFLREALSRRPDTEHMHEQQFSVLDLGTLKHCLWRYAKPELAADFSRL